MNHTISAILNENEKEESESMIKQGSRVKVHFYGAVNIQICLVILKICLLETLLDELNGITAFLILVSRGVRRRLKRK